MDNVNNNEVLDQAIDSKFFDILRIMLYSLIGIIIFFIPVKIDGKVKTLLFHMAYKVQIQADSFVKIYILIYVTLGCIKDLIKYNKKKFSREKLLAYSKILSILILIDILYSKNTSVFFNQNILFLAEETILNIAIILPLSAIFMPFIIEYGLLDIVEAYCHKFMKKYFNMSGKTILNILFYIFTDCFCGYFMTEKLYKDGKLRQNEACSIILNFSILSIPMIIYTSEELNLNKLHLILISLIILVITNIILSKSYPLNKKKKSYYIKTTYKEKYYKTDKLKNSLQKCLENKTDKSIFKHITSNLEEVIYKLTYLIPNIILTLFIINILINNELIIYILNQLTNPIYEILKTNNQNILNTFILNVFCNNAMAIDCVYINTSLEIKFLIGIISILSCTSITTSIIYIKNSLIPINNKEFIISYIERIIIIVFIYFLLYYFYIGYIK